MSLTPGSRLGNYEILGPLGKGGMGEVYRAKDTKLGREVAVKVLPAAFANHPERLARFEREAKVLASLNHPNIATIYAVEESDEGKALIMELVPGETLKGPVSLDTALKYAGQIASALEAAHEKGITHRDLKPGNIMLTPQGVIKVLDFGLAAVTQHTTNADDGATLPTVTQSPTQAGAILGTAAYMSPEQARGEVVDHRADIWSFGVVLYELLTGKRLFNGKSVADVLAMVITKEPDWAPIPSRVRWLLKRCLDRDLKSRLQAIGDWQHLLLDEHAPTVASAKSRLPWIAAAVATAGAITFGYIAWRHINEESPTIRLEVPAPLKGLYLSTPAISPDGRHLALVTSVDGKSQLSVRDIDSVTARVLPGTDDSSLPFWSPDSRSIGFFAEGKLKRIDIAAGAPIVLADAPGPRGGSWSKNGVIVFTPGYLTGLQKVSAGGGTASELTKIDTSVGENAHRMPWFLPDGRHLLYTARTNDPTKSTVYVADVESQDPKSRRAVLTAGSNVIYTPPGYLLFVRGDSLMAQPFDLGKLQTAGEALPIAPQIDFDPLNLVGRFSASQNSSGSGILAYGARGQGSTTRLTWVDHAGKVVEQVGPAALLRGNVEISPDGNTVAYDVMDAATGALDIWMHDLKRGTDSRFTFSPAGSRGRTNMVWSGDGSRLAFHVRDAAGYSTSLRSFGTTAPEERIGEPSLYQAPTDWSNDGRYLVLEDGPVPGTGYDLLIMPAAPGQDHKVVPYLRTPANERQGRLSPDSRWLAYSSDETKRMEVYVQTFPTPGGQQQISINGGTRPVWSRDGKLLYFVSGDGKMMEVAVKSGAKLEVGAPKVLFDTRPLDVNFANTINLFDVDKDGRFLLPLSVNPEGSVPVTVVYNWLGGLKH